MARFNETITPSGYGYREEQLHVATGLRNSSIHALISTDLAGIVNDIPIGSQTGLARTEWGGPQIAGTTYTSMRAAAAAALTPWNGHLPTPMTPTISIIANSTGLVTVLSAGSGTATMIVQFRVRGQDQFGCAIEEITPPITLSTKGYAIGTDGDYFTLIHLSKVFSYVHDVEYLNYGASDGTNGHLWVTSPPATFRMGWCTVIDPVPLGGSLATALIRPLAALTVDTGTQVAGIENWGIGTPLRIAPYGPAIPFANPEYIGGTATILREKTTPTVLNTTVRVPGRGQTIAGSLPTAGFALGRSASGWQGTPHKLGFFSNDNWATNKISGIDLTGSSNRASDRPTSYAQLGEDELQIVASIRSSIGSRRGSNPTSSYPRG